MNKVLDSDDEVNKVKRKPRTKGDLSVVRPWQNLIMVKFLDMLFKSSRNGYVLRSTVLNKFNEAGVPITWQRMASLKTYFEKKNHYPPFSLQNKVTVIVPLKDPEANVARVEECITEMIIKRVDTELSKFKLPIRINDIQKDY